MHRYLRAIGFSKFKTKREIKSLLDHVYRDPTTSSIVYDGEEKCGYVGKSYGQGFGIRVFGSYEDDWNFEEEYYFPYVESSLLSTTQYCSVERHTNQNAYGGIIEDDTQGLSVIFYLNNGIDYINKQKQEKREVPIKAVSLNALCTSGRILLPVYKTETEKKKLERRTRDRVSLIEAARNGDEQAMESLALDDMNVFNSVSNRIACEDLYSIVDTCFMPCGLESEQYSVVGEIHKIENLKNTLTDEDCLRLTIECNGLDLTVMLNATDLLGEPAVGRRFKGDIWLQGTVLY